MTDFDDDVSTDEGDGSPEGLLEVLDDDPVTRESSVGITGDFEFDRTVTGPPVELSTIGKARASVPIHDSTFKDVMEIAQTLKNTFGDKDEAVSRYAEDLIGSLQVLYLEFSNYPGMVLQRLILGVESNPTKQQRMLREARAALDAVERQLSIPQRTNVDGHDV